MYINKWVTLQENNNNNNHIYHCSIAMWAGIQALAILIPQVMFITGCSLCAGREMDYLNNHSLLGKRQWRFLFFF